MGKQADVKSQTSGPFALTWQNIQGYGQLKQQQYLRLDNQSNCKVKFSFEGKKAGLHVIIHVLIPYKSWSDSKKKTLHLTPYLVNLWGY